MENCRIMPLFYYIRKRFFRPDPLDRKGRDLRRTVLKRLLGLLLAVGIMMGGAATGEGTPGPAVPETPAPVRIARPEPEPTPEMPAVINCAADPGADAGFHFPMDAELLHIWFPNIMNADEAILMYQGEVWLIDCGDEKMGARGAELIGRLGISRIRKLFNTHPHHDHLNGLRVTDQAAKVEELLICFGAASTEHMIRAVTYAEENGIRVAEFRDGSEFGMGDGAVSLKFWHNTDPYLDMNNQSAITMVRYGERTILFTADAERSGQANLLSRVPAAELKADLLKYPHHGKSPLDDDFLQAVSPDAAIVTNRTVPDWNGVKYLTAKGIPFIYTNQNDVYLHLVTDGQHWIAEQVPRDRVPAMTDEPGGT